MPSESEVKAAFSRALSSPQLAASDFVRSWMRRLECKGLGPQGEVLIAVPDLFHRDFIEDHFAPDLVEALAEHLPSPVELGWVVDERLRERLAESPLPSQGTPAADPAAPAAVQPAPPPRPSDHPLDERFTFDTFVCAPSNQLAYSGARAVADNPGTAFNPLFIYGGTGLGKTHLLHAIGNALLAADSRRRILYVSSEEFTNDFISSVRDHRMPEFRRKYREELDCLLIDDIQFLATREMTQEEFFHTFNTLQAARKPVAITSDTIPSEIAGLAERLRTRFSSGLIADIQEPDFETRVAILKKKAQGLGIQLPDDVACYIAETIQRNVRELQMALNRVYAHYSLAGQPLTLELAKQILRTVLPKPQRIDIDAVQREAGKYFKVSVDELRGTRRVRRIVHARQCAMYLARELTDASYPTIGAAFNRDHSTVISSCEKIAAELPTSAQLRKELDEISARLSR